MFNLSSQTPVFSAETQPLLITHKTSGVQSQRCVLRVIRATQCEGAVGSLSTQTCRPGCQAGDADLQEEEDELLGAQVTENDGLPAVPPERDWEQQRRNCGRLHAVQMRSMGASLMHRDGGSGADRDG